MELKKPANPWELLPGAPNIDATKLLASAIRINVTNGSKTPPAEQASMPTQASERLLVQPTARAQTPLPTRRQHAAGRQFLAA